MATLNRATVRLPQAALQRRVPVRPMQSVQTPSPLDRFVRAQAINTTRNAAALHAFRRDEFGTGPASPSEAHIRAANQLIVHLRDRLLGLARRVDRAAVNAAHAPSTRSLQMLLGQKERAGRWIKLIERIWDFYFELFQQRQTRFAPWLLGADRIALDCYQVTYTGLGRARSIPTPPPFLLWKQVERQPPFVGESR